MKNYMLLPQEVLSLTAGKLTLHRYTNGASIEFIRYFLDCLNSNFNLKGITETVHFDAYIPFEKDLKMFNTKWNIWQFTYEYDETGKVFYAKKEFLYNVLLHLEVVEKKIFDLVVLKAVAKKMKSFEKVGLNKEINDLLEVNFNKSKRKFGF